MRCEARILRIYKTKKADVVWPESVYGPTPADHMVNGKRFGDLEVCGGEVTLAVKAETDGCPCCSGTTELKVEAECTRCKSPYFPRIFELNGTRPEVAVSQIVNDGIAAWSRRGAEC